MTPERCDLCRHFIPDTINPAAGMGECAKGLGYWHPAAPHWCKQHEPAK